MAWSIVRVETYFPLREWMEPILKMLSYILIHSKHRSMTEPNFSAKKERYFLFKRKLTKSSNGV